MPSTRVLNTVPAAPVTTSPSRNPDDNTNSMQRYKQFLSADNSNPVSTTITSKAKALNSPKHQPVYIFSASKDGGISKHDFNTQELLWHVPGGVKPTKKAKKMYGGADKLNSQHVGHTDQVLCLDVSEDGKYLVSRWLFHVYLPGIVWEGQRRASVYTRMADKSTCHCAFPFWKLGSDSEDFRFTVVSSSILRPSVESDSVVLMTSSELFSRNNHL